MFAMQITEEVLTAIRQQIGSRPAEAGGVLGGNRASGTVTAFYFDETAATSRGTYSPNHEVVNRLLAEDWNPRGIDLLGFVHSHPAGIRVPSGGDQYYARR